MAEPLLPGTFEAHLIRASGYSSNLLDHCISTCGTVGAGAPLSTTHIYIYTLHYMAIYIHSQGHLPKTKLSLVVTVLKTKLNLVEEALGSIEYHRTHMGAMMKVTNKEHISSASPHHVPFRSSVALFQEAPGLDNKPQLSSMGLTTGAVTEGWWGRWMLMVGIYIYICIYICIYIYIKLFF